MEAPSISSAETSAPANRSSSSSANLYSPTASTFSRGHSSQGSGSSITSSPLPRDSLDMVGVTRRLADVTEEPQEKDEFDGYTLVNDRSCDWDDYDKALSNDYHDVPPIVSPLRPGWSLPEPEEWSVGDDTRQPKRRRSMEQLANTHSHRIVGKIGSLSRRWKNRSAAGPQLSIITHHSTPVSRSESLSSPQILSPALSAVSRHDSGPPSSPILPLFHDSPLEATSAPMDILRSSEGEDVETGQATTPLLPPLLFDLSKREEQIHSPLQSPAMAPTTASIASNNPLDTPMSCLPSPPLSTKPSMMSMHSRSRTNTTTNSPFSEIPSLHLTENRSDPWDLRLGHANFAIHPEPYQPEYLDLDSYAEYRGNWDQARTNYAKHIARTTEHYGSTSRVYKLTEEKWASIDSLWKGQHDLMRTALEPILARLSDSDSKTQDSTASSTVLDRPATKVIVPVIDDKSGKFPELGDGEIVGPMSVGRPRVPAMGSDSTHGWKSPPLSPHKRNLIRFFADIFHN